jgi:hypothetical protein
MYISRIDAGEGKVLVGCVLELMGVVVCAHGSLVKREDLTELFCAGCVHDF